MSMEMPAGNGAPHAAPTTPAPLVQDSVEAVTEPDTDAVPVHVAPLNAMPVNVSWPLNDPLLNEPDT